MSLPDLLTFKNLPFIVLSVLGWILSFIGVAVRQASFDASVGNRLISKNPLSSTWLSLFLNLFIILGVIVATFYNSLHTYKHALSTFFSVAIVLLIFEADATVYGVGAGSDAGNGLSATGSIFLLIAFFYKVLLLGSEENSRLHSTMNGLGGIQGGGSQRQAPPASSFEAPKYSNNNTPASNQPSIQQINVISVPQQQPAAAAPLPVATSNPTSTPSQVSSSTAPLQAGLKATSLYAYDANPSDPNEISFVKGEVLEVTDNKGKWWKVKKQNGTQGIAPSNYLQLV